MQNKGIIVFRHKNSSRATILDCQNGMKEIIFSANQRWDIGSFISYSIVFKRNNYFIEHFMLEDSPLWIARQDLAFLHYIFEILYSFAPLNNYIEGLFEHITILYSIDITNLIQSKKWKKIFIAKILFFLDIYHEENKSLMPFLYKIKHMPIDRIDPDSLNLTDEQNIDSWLHYCFINHQKLHELKINYFKI